MCLFVHHSCLVQGDDSVEQKKINQGPSAKTLAIKWKVQSHQITSPTVLGKVTSAPILDAQLMVEHSSGLTCVNLMISISQDKNLGVKEAFKICTVILGIKIHRYHAYNVIFASQNFKSSIEESNQTITLCGNV